MNVKRHMGVVVWDEGQFNLKHLKRLNDQSKHKQVEV